MAKKSVKQVRKPGSTIDDSARLAKLAVKLKSAPELSLAEAIKSIGVKDRASVRRLRDKYRRGLNGSVTAMTKSGATIAATSTKTAGKPKQPAMALRASGTAKTKRSPKTSNGTAKIARKAAKTARKSNGTTPQQPVATQSAPTGTGNGVTPYGMIMPPWLSIGLDLSAAAMHSQVQFYEQMMRMSPISGLVKQQAGIFKALSGFYSTSANAAMYMSKQKSN